MISNPDIITVRASVIYIGAVQARAMGMPKRVRCYIDKKGRGIITASVSPKSNVTVRGMGNSGTTLGDGFSFAATVLARYWGLQQGKVACSLVGGRIIIEGITPRPELLKLRRKDHKPKVELSYDFEGWPND
jgi:hypothetical protein